MSSRDVLKQYNALNPIGHPIVILSFIINHLRNLRNPVRVVDYDK